MNREDIDMGLFRHVAGNGDNMIALQPALTEEDLVKLAGFFQNGADNFGDKSYKQAVKDVKKGKIKPEDLKSIITGLNTTIHYKDLCGIPADEERALLEKLEPLQP